MAGITTSEPWTGFDTFESGASHVERFLNDYFTPIPFVSVLSGSLRFIGGLIQAVTGATLGVFAALAAYVQTDQRALDNDVPRFFSYVKHGLGNMVRLLEAIPIWGNLAFTIYDRYFESRMKYPVENKNFRPPHS